MTISTTHVTTVARAVGTVTLFALDQFGIIEYFLEARSHSGMVFVFAVVKVLSVTHALNCTHLFAAEESGTVKLVPVTSIVSKCVCINVGTELFVGTFPCHFLPMLS